MKFINDDGSVYNAIPKFIEQLKIKEIDRQYNAGVVCEKNGNYSIGYEMRGAEETFSIGQPVYDKDKNIMGWLGIGLFENLDYSAKVRVPCEYWQICLPTKFCKVGKQVYTYWQTTEVESQESEKINCKSTKCEKCQNHNYCDFEPQESEEV